jgi:hypothetical protein
MKRLESKPTTSYSISASSAVQKEVSPFEAMKATIRNNLKGLKKEEDKESGDHSGLGGLGSSTSVGNNPSVIGGTSNAGGAGITTSRRVSLKTLTFYVASGYHPTFQLWRGHQEDRSHLQCAVITNF